MDEKNAPLVSVIVPTFNRFRYLKKAVQSIQNQTYSNIEIIVVNDCSTQPEYYTHDWSGIKIIHLEKNSKESFGYGCVGFVRNQGINIANGKYVAFCDDDDIWLPNKLELQINGLQKNPECKMSCTDGYIGKGFYKPNKKKYKKYNAEYYFKILNKIYKDKLSKEGFPKIWNLSFIKRHNCIITSSVIIERKLLRKIRCMPFQRRGQDYKCWLKALEHTKCLYLTDCCIYYDINHGDGRNH